MSFVVGALILVAVSISILALGVAIAIPKFRLIAAVVGVLGLVSAFATLAFFLFIVSRMG